LPKNRGLVGEIKEQTAISESSFVITDLKYFQKNKTIDVQAEYQ